MKSDFHTYNFLFLSDKVDDPLENTEDSWDMML